MQDSTVITQSRARSFIIKRPRLTALLDSSGARVMLLVAPAGYGKTTLAREWLAARRRPLAWYRASPASEDVAALASGLAADLDAAVADGETVSSARVAELTAVHQRPDVLARVLAASRPAWPPQLVVAIDDYHQLGGSAAAEFVGTLVSLLPATFLIMSRTRPEWFTPRLTIYGEALEVATTELTMTDAEGQQVFDASPHPSIAGSILGLARGWPAVIGLAARSGRQEFPTRTMPRRLYEFLADDLVHTAPEEAQEALTILAVCGTDDPALARALLGPRAQIALAEAERRGLLTFEDSGRLALHPLLGEFLIEKLRERPAAEVVRVVEPVARTLLHGRHWDECLAMAEAVGADRAVVAEVLEGAMQELVASGRVATVRRWIGLARSLDMDEPIVELAESEVALRDGEYDRAMALGARAASRLPTDDERSRAYLVAARAAHLADQRARAGDWFSAAESCASSLDLRSIAVWGRFLVESKEESEQLELALERLAAVDDGTVDHQLRLAHGRFVLSLARGSVHAALEAAQAANALLPLAKDPLVRLSSLNQHAWILAASARYEEALEAADRVLLEAEAAGVDFVVNHGLLARARALIGLRRFAAAHQATAGLLSRLRKEPDAWTAANLAVQQARLHLSLGDLDRAADDLLLDIDERQSTFMRAEHLVYRALVAAARGQAAEAASWVEQSLRLSRHVDARAVALVTEAILAVQGGRQPIRSVAAVLESGHLDALVMGCRAWPELPRTLVLHDAFREPLRAILIGSTDEPIARAAGLRIPRSARRSADLSPRELGVYELMVEGRTNKEIARLLYISESTTKVHVRHILEKLGARSRVEAVRAWDTPPAAG